MERFNGVGYGVITFPYPETTVTFTAENSTTISFDGGQTFMNVTDGTYTWRVGLIKTVVFGDGYWEIYGPSGTTNTGIVSFEPSQLEGITGWWSSDNVDGINNASFSDGDRVSLWKDMSNNDYHLTRSGDGRPNFVSADTSGDSPTFPAVDFNETGATEHYLYSSADFESILPSDGKSFYACLHLDEYAGAYGGGDNKGLVSRVFGDVAYPSKLSLEYTRYSGPSGSGNKFWDFVLVEDNTIINSVRVGSGIAFPPFNGKYIVSFRHDGTNAWLASKNGSYENSSKMFPLGTTPDAAFFGLRFAYISHDMEYFEAITFDRKLTDEEDQQMLEYLNDKWNVGATDLDFYPWDPDSLTVTSGLTGHWKSDNIDGYNNNTLVDQDFIDTWVDLSGNSRDLEISGDERPYYSVIDTESTAAFAEPKHQALTFNFTGTDEHRIGSYPDTDFEDFLPSAGKSFYMVCQFDGTPIAWTLGAGRNLISDGGQTISKWGLEYARYSTSNTDYNIIFHQDGAYVDHVTIGTSGSSPNNDTRFIVSFRQAAHNGSTDNYWLEVYNQDGSRTDSTSGIVTDTVNLNWFNIMRCLTDKPRCFVYEVLTYDSSLSDIDNATVVAYLNNNWHVGATL